MNSASLQKLRLKEGREREEWKQGKPEKGKRERKGKGGVLKKG
jgi:hypothetical protein